MLVILMVFGLVKIFAALIKIRCWTWRLHSLKECRGSRHYQWKFSSKNNNITSAYTEVRKKHPMKARCSSIVLVRSRKARYASDVEWRMASSKRLDGSLGAGLFRPRSYTTVIAAESSAVNRGIFWK